MSVLLPESLLLFSYTITDPLMQAYKSNLSLSPGFGAQEITYIGLEL